MRAGLDVRGGGPACRESQLLNPLMSAEVVHGIVLAGGSAYGLDAAGGVMQYLEEQNIGFDVGVTKVPLVAQADIFDLTVGDASVRLIKLWATALQSKLLLHQITKMAITAQTAAQQSERSAAWICCRGSQQRNYNFDTKCGKRIWIPVCK